MTSHVCVYFATMNMIYQRCVERRVQAMSTEVNLGISRDMSTHVMYTRFW